MNPPRAAFLNYPLGHTAGRPNELDEQVGIVRSALARLHDATEPGQMKPLSLTWPTEWHAKARTLSDNRSERHDTPQYQHAADEEAVTTGS